MNQTAPPSKKIHVYVLFYKFKIIFFTNSFHPCYWKIHLKVTYPFMLSLHPIWSEIISERPSLSAHRFNIMNHIRLENFFCIRYVKQNYVLKGVSFNIVFTRRKQRFYQRRNDNLFYPWTNHTII